jgi:hypothetical protein
MNSRMGSWQPSRAGSHAVGRRVTVWATAIPRQNDDAGLAAAGDVASGDGWTSWRLTIACDGGGCRATVAIPGTKRPTGSLEPCGGAGAPGRSGGRAHDRREIDVSGRTPRCEALPVIVAVGAPRPSGGTLPKEMRWRWRRRRGSGGEADADSAAAVPPLPRAGVLSFRLRDQAQTWSSPRRQDRRAPVPNGGVDGGVGGSPDHLRHVQGRRPAIASTACGCEIGGKSGTVVPAR